MHWCVNINPLQRPFLSCCCCCCWSCCLNKSHRFPLWNIIRCSSGRRFTAADGNVGRQEDAEGEGREDDFTFQLPLPPGSLSYRKCPTSAPLHLASRISCVIKPLSVTYVHATGQDEHSFSSSPGSRPREPAGLGPERGGEGGGSTWLVEDGSGVVLQKQTGTSSQEEGEEESDGLRLDCRPRGISTRLSATGTPHTHTQQK